MAYGFQRPGLRFVQPVGGLVGFQRQGMDMRKKASGRGVAVFPGNGRLAYATLEALGVGDFTAEAWVRPSALAAQVIVSTLTGSGDGSAQRWALIGRADGSLELFSGGAVLNSGAGVMTVDRWYHVAVSREAGTLRMFVDGQQVGSAAYASNLLANTTTVGQYPDASGNFSGSISEVRLTAAALYTSSFARPGPLTVGAAYLLAVTRRGFDDVGPSRYPATVTPPVTFALVSSLA